MCVLVGGEVGGMLRVVREKNLLLRVVHVLHGMRMLWIMRILLLSGGRGVIVRVLRWMLRMLWIIRGSRRRRPIAHSPSALSRGPPRLSRLICHCLYVVMETTTHRDPCSALIAPRTVEWISFFSLLLLRFLERWRWRKAL